jgi:hypothetical protein
LFRGAEFETDHYLRMAEVRERLAESKQISNKFHIKRFSLKKLNEVEVIEKYHVQISNRFTALVNLDAEVAINRAWETNRENMRISVKENLGYYELKKQKQWFDRSFSKLLD